jgi:hypothetical protein
LKDANLGAPEAPDIEHFNFMESFSSDPLKIAIHPGGWVHDAADLFLSLCPEARHGPPFFVQVFVHLCESLNDRFHALPPGVEIPASGGVELK